MWFYRYKMFCFTNLNGITPPLFEIFCIYLQR